MADKKRVVVWGTGFVGKMIIPEVLRHPNFELVGVGVNDQDKVGRDAGEICGIGPIGITATDDLNALIALRPDALVHYGPTAGQADANIRDIGTFLRAGIDVSSTAMTPWVWPSMKLNPPSWIDPITEACAEGGATCFTTGIDPGFANDLFPMTLMGLCAEVRKVKALELVDYINYTGAYEDEMGIGRPPEFTPLLEHTDILVMSWGATVPMMAHAAGVELDAITSTWDKWVTEVPITTAKGVINPGEVAAIHFTIDGMYKGEPRICLEHVNRVGTDAAPDWPRGTQDDVYRVEIEGTPSITQETAFRFTDGSGRDAVAAGCLATGLRALNAVPAVNDLPPGWATALDLPLIPGGGDHPLTPVVISYEEAYAELTGPGRTFELGEDLIDGVHYRVFTNAPPTLVDAFAASREDESTFLVYEDERWSFKETHRHIDALAHTLVHTFGVQKGHRVGIAMRNLPEWIVSFAAILSIGAVSVSFNAWWTESELDYALEDSGSVVLIVDGERVERAHRPAALRQVPVIAARVAGGQVLPSGVQRYEDVVTLGDPMPAAVVLPEDDATILYTSGTTGFPKGAVSTHRAVTQSLMAFWARAAIEAARQGREGDTPDTPSSKPSFILIVPLFHVTGCVPVMLSCFGLKMKLVMMYRWDPEVALRLIEAERVTAFVGVPTQSWDLLESAAFSKYDTSSLASIGGGGAPAPVKLVERVEDSFSDGRPNIGYGMTETNAFGPGNTGDDYVTHPSSTGRAKLTIVDIEIRDSEREPVPTGVRGEIWMKGPNLIRGYWNKPEATAEVLVDGWLATGDLGRIDDEGFLYIEDRAKDMVLRGGENVYSAEVESAIYEHPDVYEAAVFGVPDERLGEVVATVITPRPGSTLDADELRRFLDGKLSPFKIPSRIAFSEERLPRNPSGKVLKRELRDTFFGPGK